MTDQESEDYFILVDSMIHIANDGIRLCTDDSDFNVKYDPGANLFATYCPQCQSKKTSMND